MNTTQSNHQVVFHTNTEIDPRAWSVMGMHAKESDSPIGMFGTGLKYCLAILLRTNHEVTVFSNGKKYEFGLIKSEFRGKEFEQVTCNGVPLPFTTEYGKKWELEGAYRELVSNTIDEGGIHFSGEPMEDGTSIVVKGEDFHKILNKHNELFVGDREPIVIGKPISIYEGNGILFYRGVKIGIIEDAGFSYEINHSIDLTEDRSIKSIYEANYRIMYFICCQLTDKKLIKRILSLPEGKWEKSDERDYDWTWSKEFSEVVKEIWAVDPTSLPLKVQRCVQKNIPDASFSEIDKSEYEPSIEKAKEFLKDAGYPITDEIVVVKNSEPNLIAFAYSGKIHLTEKSFERGLVFLAEALLEEQMHLNGYSDMTRHFQTYLIQQIVLQAKKRLKVTL